jgi:hypothetical protein
MGGTVRGKLMTKRKPGRPTLVQTPVAFLRRRFERRREALTEFLRLARLDPQRWRGKICEDEIELLFGAIEELLQRVEEIQSDKSQGVSVPTNGKR